MLPEVSSGLPHMSTFSKTLPAALAATDFSDPLCIVGTLPETCPGWNPGCPQSALEAASGTSLLVQWLRLSAFNVGNLGSIPDQGTRSQMLQLKEPVCQKDPAQPNKWKITFPGGSDGKESACHARDLGQDDPLEKEMATHSSILAWRIPWTEEPSSYSP